MPLAAKQKKQIIGGLIITGTIVGELIMFISDRCLFQTFKFYALIIMALGFLYIVSVFPGDVQLTSEWNFKNFKNIKLKATQSQGLFFALILIGLTVFSTETDFCNPSFNISFLLRDQKNREPKQKGGTLALILDNDYDSTAINSNGIAEFKNLPSNYLNTPLVLELKLRGWAFENKSYRDTVGLKASDKSVTVSIRHDSLFSRIFGTVRDQHGNPISGVILTVGTFTEHSDSLGDFVISITEEEQGPLQQITAYKKGFTTYRNEVQVNSIEPYPIELVKDEP